MFIDPRRSFTSNVVGEFGVRRKLGEPHSRDSLLKLRLYRIIRYNRDIIGFICGTTRARNSPVAPPTPRGTPRVVDPR